MAGALEQTDGTSTIQAIYLNGVLEKSAEFVLIDERGMTEEAGRIDEVVLIEGAPRRDE